MRYMKTLISIILFCAFSASAQYRFNVYRYSIATNATIATNVVATIGTAVDVGSGSEAVIQVAFKQSTNGFPANATNALVTVWDWSLDGTRFTNRFTFSVYGNNTTNIEAWATTNILTEMPWLRFVNATNLTGATVTNYSVTVGNRIGL